MHILYTYRLKRILYDCTHKVQKIWALTLSQQKINPMKTVTMMLALSLWLTSCGSNDGSSTSSESSSQSASSESTGGNPDYDPKRGTGKFSDVVVSPTLDKALAEKGKATSDVKCGSCHKLTDEKLVGPGWKGVTSRHTPAWILNFMTNTDEMINKDPAAQAQLEICLVRMPNQNLSDDEAKSLYEFMRQNDGVK